ncbi:PREDICTED: accelerated cell death [Prunus dulcis]|uniref:PREDICTED: accelerated cell death n=1 Tax=Prunus dulcis TaxID=3755 RepID=A0A5E4FPD1_PRUDU|nr:PREDICTED: accelerated cell death [Prunus dulcis]
MANEKPLRKISEAFKELEAAVNSQTAEIEVAPFSSACSLVSPLFGCLGIAFKFAEIDYVAKVHDLAEASKSISTLTVLLDRDIEGDCVRKAGSHSRNLLRVKRGLDMVRVLFEQIIVTKYVFSTTISLHYSWTVCLFISNFIVYVLYRKEKVLISNGELHLRKTCI